jgi:hypothetical protein
MAASLNAGRHDAGGDGRAAGVGLALNYTLQLYASVDTVNTAVIPFITLASDTIANQQFTGKLLKGLEFHVSIVDSDIGRKMSSGVGELQLDNSDRAFDTLYANNTIDGRRVLLKYGQITIPGLVPSSFDTYPTLLDGIAEDWFLDSRASCASHCATMPSRWMCRPLHQLAFTAERARRMAMRA